jgi:gluconate 2-dehydrogenase
MLRILVGAAARGRPEQYRKEIAAMLPVSLGGAEFVFDLHDGDDDWGPELAHADALVLTSRGLGAAAVSGAQRLRFVQKLGLPLGREAMETCRQRGIAVSVLPDAGHVAVAEHTLAIALGAARKLVATHNAMVRGENPAGLEPVRTTQTVRHVNWLGYAESEFRLLADQTLGVVGFGAIAREFVRRARPLFGRVVYTKRRRLSADEEHAWGVEYLPLHDLLPQADVVSLLATQPDGAPAILGAPELAAMKRGAWLVNTARGNQVDQAALMRSLRTRLGGAALDVFETEPALDRDLLDLPNVVLTPHTANLMPTGRRFAEALANIERVWGGLPPRGVA